MTDITTEDRPAGLAGVPLAIEPLKRRDFASDQEVRWCPGCGDYAILSTFQGVLPDLYRQRERRRYLGNRLFLPLPVLHEYLRYALDPWPCPGYCDGCGGVASRPGRVRHHWRRRRAVDRG